MRTLRVILVVSTALLASCSGAPGEAFPSALTLDSRGEPGGFCAALAVMERKCTRCHADPPVNGAPFSLVDYEATQAPSPSKKEPDRIRADRMLAAVESNFMPFTQLRLDPPVEALSCEERTTLLAWLRAGAQPPPDGDTSCSGSSPALLACGD